ncbi:MAG: NFACT RNA binding domain-containing protein [Nanoarchaeota archaeon]|nr:NFACT RNA binding domain-containing protein [Nanoarchaeota archaeon]
MAIKKETHGKEFYKKYRWFFTKSGKLVYGGKSAEQNEEIISNLLKEKKNYILMHTRTPGSPFSVIVSEPIKVSEEDLNEVATWTGCFSRAWRSGNKKADIDIFLTEQVYKKNGMKGGTFGVKGIIDRKIADLRLYVVKQNGVVRAVPKESIGKEKIYSHIVPGSIEKERFAGYLSEKIKVGKEEVLNALPTGKFIEVK